MSGLPINKSTLFSFPAKKIILLISIILITAASFYPSLQNDFTNWDDQVHLIKNESVRSLEMSNILRIFKEQNSVNHTYIPLTILSFALEYHFFKLNPFVYHLNNLLLHLFVVALVFILALRIGLDEWAASLAALIFGIHPMHVESVVWVTERKDVLYALFYLLSIHAYCSFSKRGKVSAYVLSLIFAVLSVCAKPMAISLPLILILLDYFSHEETWLRKLKNKIPFLIIMVAFGLMTYLQHVRSPESHGLESLLIWCWSFCFYIWKFIFPFQLSPLYEAPLPLGITQAPYALSLIGFIFIIGALFFFRKNKWITLAILFYVLSIFFLLRFDIERDLSIVANRFMYLPSLGFCFLIAHGASIFFRDQHFRGVMSTLVLCVLVWMGANSFKQCLKWKDSITLWTYALELKPDSAVPYNNRGYAYYLEGEREKAMLDYNQAISIRSDFLKAHNNRGSAYRDQKQWDLAIKDFTQSIKIKSDDVFAHHERGKVYQQQGKMVLALDDLNKVIQIRPKHLKALHRIGNINTKLNNLDLAIEAFSKSVQYWPNNADGFNNRGVVYAMKGEMELAIVDFSQAINLNPENAGAYFNRSHAQFNLKKLSNAFDDAIRAQFLGYEIDQRYLDQMNKLMEMK